MQYQARSHIQYSIMDPTGNITALVESAVPESLQPGLACVIMKLHPEVEQVGFVSLSPRENKSTAAALRMAGGEFCGNATMCAAALCLIRGAEGDSGMSLAKDCADGEVTLDLTVSGAGMPVTVRLRKDPGRPHTYTAAVRMPAALEIVRLPLSHAGITGTLPLVRMEGISHIIIEENSVFYPLIKNRASAEEAVRRWCGSVCAQGLGLIFLEKSGQAYRLTPLVYVPGSDTMFWENSCASGSAAAGMYLSDSCGSRILLDFEEPGGILSVESSAAKGITLLIGRTSLIESHTLPAEVSLPFLA